jgi:hypothetical protein
MLNDTLYSQMCWQRCKKQKFILLAEQYYYQENSLLQWICCPFLVSVSVSLKHSFSVTTAPRLISVVVHRFLQAMLDSSNN